jgi:hypothetical protein
MQAYYTASTNQQNAAYEECVTKCDFGEGTITAIPHYKWRECSTLTRRCVLVRNDTGHVPRLYDIFQLSPIEYDSHAPERAVMPLTYPSAQNYAIATNRGVISERRIHEVFGPATFGYSIYDGRVTTDYYTDELSTIANSRDKSAVFTCRADRIESTHLTTRPHVYNVFGPVIYYYTPIGMFCKDTRTGSDDHLFRDVWEKDYTGIWGSTYRISRAFTECIIGILHIITGESPHINDRRCSTYAFADMFDTRWPTEFVAEYPPVRLPHISVDIHSIAIGSFCPHAHTDEHKTNLSQYLPCTGILSIQCV